MEFRLLGPLEVRRDGEAVRLGGPRERAVLAALLLRADELATVGYLVDAVWERPPASPETNVRTYVAGLRRRLGAERLVTRPGGYVLQVREGELDITEFGEACERGRAALIRGDTAEAIRAFERALRLWRDEPLTGESYGAGLRAEAVRLAESRAEAMRGYARAKLDTGAAEDVIAQLSRVADRYPLDEELWALLVEARHRAGRRAEALETYNRVRSRLVDELGVEPGPRLRDIHAAIVHDEPNHHPSPRPLPPIPAELPADLATFTGRETELGRLERLLTGTGRAVVISAIDGMAGIGKTSLVVHFAHRVRDRFPDGQLFLDLHGHTEAIDPVTPDHALNRMLTSLGVPGDRIPAGVEERAALYRTLLADRRVLVVLDNAVSEHQVGPLLPAATGSLVLITSRRRLTGLDHAEPLSVDVLGEDEAIALLDRITGPVDRVAARDVVALCGHLPLAIRIAGARLRNRPGWTPEHLADRLRDERRRLTELSSGDRSVAAAFGLSYRQLTEQQQRVFRLLGLHPGTDFDTYAAAALADLDIQRISRVLDELVDAHMLVQQAPDRYTFHDLLRGYAAGLTTELAPGHDDALSRLVDHYVYAASVAVNRLHPDDADQRPDVPRPSPPVPPMDDAAGWLETELENLLAATAGDPIRLSQILYRHLRTRGRHTEALAIHAAALRAAEPTGDATGRLDALRGLGDAQFLLGRHTEAEDHYREMLRLARSTGSDAHEGWALRGLGTVHRVCGRPSDAVESYDQALDIARRIGDLPAERHLRMALGNAHMVAGRHAQAAECYRRALDVAREIEDRVGEAHALMGHGWVDQLEGRLEQAMRHHQQALDIAMEAGEPAGQVAILAHLGVTHRLLGELEPARQRHREALDIARREGWLNGQFEALHELGNDLQEAGEFGGALDHHRQALDIARSLNQRHDEGRALEGIALASYELGEVADARSHWGQALEIFSRLGTPDADRVAARLSQPPPPRQPSQPGQPQPDQAGRVARSGVS
jgi:DNA-binding SARP family transcriptional activator/Flp pilus assembly protein TadD